MQRLILRRFSKAFASVLEYNQNNSPADIELATLRKRLIYRSSNLGMLELDIMVGGWTRSHVEELNKDQCLAFEQQVLNQETPNLYFQLLGTEPVDENDLPEFIQIIRKQAKNRSDN